MTSTESKGGREKRVTREVGTIWYSDELKKKKTNNVIMLHAVSSCSFVSLGVVKVTVQSPASQHCLEDVQEAEAECDG